MNVIVWSINYHPELVGIGVYNTQMCEFLARRGHRVRMLTGFPYYPEWKKRRHDLDKLYESDIINRVELMRCWQYVPRKVTVLQRMIHEATFVITSFIAALFMHKPDVYVVVSPPLLLGIAAFIMSKLKRRPFIFHIQDMQPGAAVRVGLLKPGRFVRLLCRIETFIYQHADLVTGITDQMVEEIIANGGIKERTTLFPNWVDLPSDEDKPEPGTWKKLRGFNPKTRLVTYSGNIGKKQGIEIILEAARILKDEKDLKFIICGSGSHRAEIEKLGREKHLTHVYLGDLLPEHEHSELLVDSHVCLVPQLAGTGASFFPSKLLKILAYKCAVVTNADPSSPLYAAVKQSGCGTIVAPDDSAQFAEAIRELLNSDSKRKSMGESGHRWIERYSTTKVLEDFEHTLNSVVLKQPLHKPLVKDMT